MNRKKTKDLSIHTKRDRGIPLTAEEMEQWKMWSRDWSKHSHTTTNGRAGVLCRSAKRTAKNLGMGFDLTKDWIRKKLETGRCEVTDLPFDLSNRNKNIKGAGNVQKYAPSLDRKDPLKGYTKDNVQLVVWMYNVGKQTYTHEDLVEFAHALIAAELQVEHSSKQLG
jgi:hypothetical protein